MIQRKMLLILLDLCQTLTQDLSMRLLHSTIKTYITPIRLDLLFGVETISLNDGQINMLLPLNLPSRRYKYIFYYSVCGSCVLSTFAANKMLEFFPVTRPLAPHHIIIHDFPEIAGDHETSSNFQRPLNQSCCQIPTYTAYCMWHHIVSCISRQIKECNINYLLELLY